MFIGVPISDNQTGYSLLGTFFQNSYDLLLQCVQPQVLKIYGLDCLKYSQSNIYKNKRVPVKGGIIITGEQFHL